MPWLGLSLELDRAAAEALSEALLQEGALSVALENLDAPRTTLNALLARDGDPARVVAAAAAAAGLARAPGFVVAEIADEDWVRKSQAQFAPVEIGARLWIGPTWHRPPPGRAAVQLDPGLAFGTGTHPTTRLVLAFLEQCIGGGERVLDYGCGSGILAIAALRLGAASARGVDIDPQALVAARANAMQNSVAAQFAAPGGEAGFDADVVVANILANPLIALAPLLAHAIRPGGHAVLSGILRDQQAEVARAYAPWFEMAPPVFDEDWVLLAGRRREAAAA
jgi:ribosomal protein L11 methyltransferase